MQGIHTLRNLQDTKAINADLAVPEGQKKKLVIVGSSFIGTFHFATLRMPF